MFAILENHMRKILAVIGACLGLLFAHPVPSFAEAPDAVIELSGGSVAAGIGFSWGHGTLIFHGKRYAVTVSGVSLGSVGADGYTAAGSVYGLKTLRDIDGVYTSVSAEGTLAGGAGVTALKNQHGVVIQMTSTNQGLDLTLAAEGVKIALAK
jgi:hypothetical protein